jgi:hypothetical protein
LKEEEEADARLRRFVAAVRDESSADDDPIVLSPSYEKDPHCVVLFLCVR